MNQPLQSNLDPMERVQAMTDMLVKSLPESAKLLEVIAALGIITQRCFLQIPDKTERRNKIMDYIAIVARAGN